MVTLFLILGIGALLLPFIGAKIIGLIWGGLLKLGIFGRIFTTTITAIPIIFLIIALIKGNWNDTITVEFVIGMTAAFGLLLLLPIWYFFWHYYAVEDMGAFVFGAVLVGFMFFIIGGLIVGMIAAMFNETVGYIIMGAGILAGGIFYFVRTKESSCPDDDEIIIRWIAIAAAVVITIIFGLVLTGKANADIATKAAAEELNIGKTAVVVSDYVNLYSEPNTTSEVIKNLNKDETVIIQSKSVKYKGEKSRYTLFQVEHNGTKGYVISHRIRIEEE